MTLFIFLALLVVIWILDEIRKDIWYIRGKVYGPRPKAEDK